MKDSSFFILKLIEDSKDSLIRTDHKSYRIGRNEVGLPTWIWTKDNFPKEKEKELYKSVEEYLTKEWTPFTSKKEIYDLLSEKYHTKDYYEMGYLECKKLKDINLSIGFMDKPSPSDKNELLKYWKEYCKEIYPNKKFTDKDNQETVENWLNNNNFYVWRNNLGKVVCMASYIIHNKEAKISDVFTPKEERKKGYCKSLIYQMTRIFLDNNKKPLLYTDNHYEASNRAYESVGYQKKKVLINYKMKK